MKPWILLCLVLTNVPLEADSVEDLRAALAGRLALMEDVARFKWNGAMPIAAPERERALLDALTDSSADEHLPVAYLHRALGAQMAAAREYQRHRFVEWLVARQPRFPMVPDLRTVQRPAIDLATTRLLEALRAHRCSATDAIRERLTLDVPAEIPSSAWSLAVNDLFPMPRVGCPAG